MDTKEIATKISEDIVNLFSIDTSAAMQVLEDEMNNQLRYLDSVKEIYETVSSENIKLIEKIPEVESSTESLNQVFKQIDALECLTESIQEDLNKLEDTVITAEKDLGTGQNFPSVIKPFIFKRDLPTSDVSSSSRKVFHKPQFKTKLEDYFEKH